MAQLKVKQISDFITAVGTIHNATVGTAVSDAISTAVSGANGGLSTEVSRATAAEGVLSSAISAEVSNRSIAVSDVTSSLNTEISRATAAEGVLSSAISAEVSNRSIAVSDVTSSLNTEISRATAAEGTLSTAISAEVSTRSTAISAVSIALYDEGQSRITGDADTLSAAKVYSDVQKTRVDAILLASDADKDSFAEIVTLINSVDTTNDTVFAGYVLDNNAALATEVSNRISGDANTLSDAKIYTNEKVSSLISVEILNEINNRIDGDAALGQRIDNLSLDSTAAISDAVLVEKDRALFAEASIETAAQGFADLAEAAALSDAKVYADARETAITSAFQTYADLAEAAALSDAKVYADLADGLLDGRLDVLESTILEDNEMVVESFVGDGLSYLVNGEVQDGNVNLVTIYVNGQRVGTDSAMGGMSGANAGKTLVGIVNPGYTIDSGDTVVFVYQAK